MLLWVGILWSIIGDSGCVVTPVWGSTPACHVSHRSTGNMGTRPPFTCRTRPIFNGTVNPGPESGAVQGPPDAQSSFARTRRYLVRRGVSHPVRGHYPSFIAPTSSCARPNSSPWLRLSLFHGVFAGCRQSLLQDGPSRRYLCASFPRCLDPFRGGVPDASTHYFSGTIGLPPVPMGRLPATIHSATSECKPGHGPLYMSSDLI